MITAANGGSLASIHICDTSLSGFLHSLQMVKVNMNSVYTAPEYLRNTLKTLNNVTHYNN